MTRKRPWTILAVALLLCVGCGAGNREGSLEVIGPEGLKGAQVFVDGDLVGKLAAPAPMVDWVVERLAGGSPFDDLVSLELTPAEAGHPWREVTLRKEGVRIEVREIAPDPKKPKRRRFYAQAEAAGDPVVAKD